jgi:hypothetical protein
VKGPDAALLIEVVEIFRWRQIPHGDFTCNESLEEGRVGGGELTRMDRVDMFPADSVGIESIRRGKSESLFGPSVMRDRIDDREGAPSPGADGQALGLEAPAKTGDVQVVIGEEHEMINSF